MWLPILAPAGALTVRPDTSGDERGAEHAARLTDREKDVLGQITRGRAAENPVPWRAFRGYLGRMRTTHRFPGPLAAPATGSG